MYFQFRPEKAAQASGVLLRAHASREMESLRLLKLLYIADRESLKHTGRPIVGDSPVAVKSGPIHSEVQELILGTHPFEQAWSAHIARQGYGAKLVSDPGVLELSKKDIDVLAEISDRYRNDSTWDLVELTRTFPEWIKNYTEGAISTIPVGDILDGVGFCEADKAAILKDLAEELAMEKLLPPRRVLVA